MKILDPSYKILSANDSDEALKRIERAGRTCYKSEDKITEESAAKFVEMIIASGHHSVIEHVYYTVKFICDRGVSHELVRHRIASFSQESTRYSNYSKAKFGKEITVIRPYFWKDNTEQYKLLLAAMEYAEKSFMDLINSGARAEEDRSVLPNSLKTEIVVSCNLREWRHILNLRCSKAAHPQIIEVMLPLLKDFYFKYEVLFEDLYKLYCIE